MEPAMACKMLKQVKQEGGKVGTFVMDRDSTTMVKVHREVNDKIQKKTDSNHIKKGLIGSLINLSQKHSSLKNIKVRTHLVKLTMYAIKQNQGKPEKVAENLKMIVPHMYDEHQACSEKWCGYKSDPENYKMTSLPHKKPLTDATAREALDNLIVQYIGKSATLASVGSTQGNESFNNMVHSKAPKTM